jgi:hypothetical protein
MSKLQKKPSALKRGHPTLQNMNFYKFFLLLWVIFALLDPDPLTPLNPDPDPQPCLFSHQNKCNHRKKFSVGKPESIE